MTCADDCVRLPVAKAAFARHDLWSLINTGAIGYLAPSNIAAITLALLFLTAQMLMQRAAVPLVGIDVEVDPFMTDAGLFRQFQTPGDLFWTPVLAQESLDLLPSLPANTRTIGLTLPLVSQSLCMMVPIAFLAAVAPQLSRDRAFMTTKQLRDGSLIMAGFLQNAYLVSLFTGKLFIVHLCASLTWRLIKHAYAIAACS